MGFLSHFYGWNKLALKQASPGIPGILPSSNHQGLENCFWISWTCRESPVTKKAQNSERGFQQNKTEGNLGGLHKKVCCENVDLQSRGGRRNSWFGIYILTINSVFSKIIHHPKDLQDFRKISPQHWFLNRALACHLSLMVKICWPASSDEPYSGRGDSYGGFHLRLHLLVDGATSSKWWRDFFVTIHAPLQFPEVWFKNSSQKNHGEKSSEFIYN